eukprot:TRINITY_DN67790_c0_g8_i3.p1 TRINITY_DN67790_c0_g8~~TRINITY_DN67790_c0_g8_i3.p1  ORF type:complete len:456 (+),score=36.57 TRINITY_DN67790_c0_g8_i3:72-1439(+)
MDQAIALAFSETEISHLRNVFTDAKGIQSTAELATILRRLGENVTDQQVHLIAKSVGHDFETLSAANCLSLEHFFEILLLLKRQQDEQRLDPHADTIDAFVAMGGGESKEGKISMDMLKSVCTNFDLAIDLDSLLQEMQKDAPPLPWNVKQEDNVGFSQFAQMLDTSQQEEEDELSLLEESLTLPPRGGGPDGASGPQHAQPQQSRQTAFAKLKARRASLMKSSGIAGRIVSDLKMNAFTKNPRRPSWATAQAGSPPDQQGTSASNSSDDPLMNETHRVATGLQLALDSLSTTRDEIHSKCTALNNSRTTVGYQFLTNNQPYTRTRKPGTPLWISDNKKLLVSKDKAHTVANGLRIDTSHPNTSVTPATPLAVNGQQHNRTPEHEGGLQPTKRHFVTVDALLRNKPLPHHKTSYKTPTMDTVDALLAKKQKSIPNPQPTTSEQRNSNPAIPSRQQ